MLTKLILVVAILTLLPAMALADLSPFDTSRVLPTMTPITTAAYVTIFPSAKKPVTKLGIYSSSSETLKVSWAMTCAGLAASTHSVLIGPMVSGSTDLAAPTHACIGIKAVSGTAATGELDFTLF